MAFVSGVTVLVRDYDEAICWYCEALGFAVETDIPVGEGKRFVKLSEKQQRGASLVLALAQEDSQSALVGRQTDQGVFLFLQCDDFDRQYTHMLSYGVTFCEAPRDEPYAKVVVFEDLLGNQWDLIQPK